MKNLLRLFGIITISVIIGISLSACDEPGSDEGVTLSGTISISIDGQGIVPFIVIKAHDASWAFEGVTTLLAPGNNAKWSVKVPAQGSLKDVYFRIFGFTKENGTDEDKIFEIGAGFTKQLGSSSISGINLDLGALKLITISGTIVMEPNPKNAVAIELSDPDTHFLGSTIVRGVNSTMPVNWSINVCATNTPKEIYTVAVIGFPGEPWQGEWKNNYVEYFRGPGVKDIGFKDNQLQIGTANITDVELFINY